MKLTDIDHVGIAVRDLDTAIKWYEDMFGATVEHRERCVYCRPIRPRLSLVDGDGPSP